MSALSQKHFLGLETATKEDIQTLINTGFTFREILDRPIKKVPSLMGVNILPAFASLEREESLIRKNGNYRATMKGDGNFVLYRLPSDGIRGAFQHKYNLPKIQTSHMT